MTIELLPKISVVIFSYNFAKYVRECLESVLAQTLPPFEIVICDDHSTDESWTIISEYSQRYPELVRFYRHERNMGQVHNGNFGRKIAKGDLVTFLDGDDRWLPRKLELEWKALQRHPEARIAYSNVYTIDTEGNRTGVWHGGKGLPPPSGDVFIEVYSRCFFPNTGSLFRNQLMYRSALEEVGYNALNLESYWDWDEKIRLTSCFPVAYSGEALVEYRQHSGGFSKNEPAKHIRAMIDVYEKHQHLLDSRTEREAVRVRCNLESLIARSQLRLPYLERHELYLPRPVYDRNRHLLDQLPPGERKGIEAEVGESFALLAWLIAAKALKAGDLKLASSYWSELSRYDMRAFDLKRFALHLLPRKIRERLSDVYHRFSY